MKNSLEKIKTTNVVPYLVLCRKEGNTVVNVGGVHTVKLLQDKSGTKKDYNTGKSIDVMWYLVEEDGIKKKYSVPVMDDKGEDLHYLFEKLSHLKEGTELTMEYTRQKGSFRGFIKTEVLGEIAPDRGEEISEKEKIQNEIPTIQEDTPLINDGEVDEVPF